jgi:hypothetical protein
VDTLDHFQLPLNQLCFVSQFQLAQQWKVHMLISGKQKVNVPSRKRDIKKKLFSQKVLTLSEKQWNWNITWINFFGKCHLKQAVLNCTRDRTILMRDPPADTYGPSLFVRHYAYGHMGLQPCTPDRTAPGPYGEWCDRRPVPYSLGLGDR